MPNSGRCVLVYLCAILNAPYPRQRLNHARQPSRSASTHNPDAKICMLTSDRRFR
jgi:hypothetical protein